MRAYFKVCETPEKAAQEAAAMVKARRRLDRVSLRVPRRLLLCDKYLVTELIEKEGLVSDCVGEALGYLKAMHSIPTDGITTNHYHGGHLRHRLEQEQHYIRYLTADVGWCQPALDAVTRALSLGALSAIDLAAVPPVVGHGDFHKSNVLVAANRQIVPIDWVDFGLCDPRYEVAHFLDSLDFNDIEMVRITYNPRWPSGRTTDDDLKLGGIINAIIELGSIARQGVENARLRRSEAERWIAKLDA
jgi:hypothetical protein